MNRTLYEIGGDMTALDDILSQAGGDVTEEEIEAQIEAWFKENEDHLQAKLDGYGSVMRNREIMAAKREAEAAVFKDESDRLKRLAMTDKNLVIRLKSRLKDFFKSRDIKKVETTMFKFWIQGNGGKAPLLIPEEILYNPADKLDPSLLIYHDPTINTERLREILQAGGDEAAELPEGIKLGERGDSLQIR